MIGKVKINKDVEKQMKANQKGSDGWVQKRYDAGLPTCILVDIDGTLAIRGNRGVYEFDKAELDSCSPQVQVIMALLAENNQTVVSPAYNVRIFIFSGREDKYKTQTERWLKNNNVPYDAIHMRPTGDKRNDAIVKKEMYENIIKDKYNVLFIIDDRTRVVKMWRSLGLFVFDVNQSGLEY